MLNRTSLLREAFAFSLPTDFPTSLTSRHQQQAMAEVFGIAAAGIGIAPAAFELDKSTEKLREYCRSVRSAREDIQDLVDEVDGLQAVLLQLEELGVLDCYTGSSNMQRCHELCTKANNTLSSVVVELQQDIKLRSRRSQLVLPLKKERIKQLVEKIASAKSSLLLACNVYLMWQTKTQARAPQQLLVQVFDTVQSQ